MAKARNRGQIILKDKDVWTVRIFRGRDGEGRKRYFNATVKGNRSAAQKYLTGKLRELDTGSFVDAARQPLNSHLDEWLRIVKSRVATQTYNSYESTLRVHIRPRIGLLRLANIRTQDIQRVYSEMQDNGLSPRSVRYAHAILSMAMKKAVELSVILRDPCQFTDLPRESRKETKAFNPQQAANFVRAAQSDSSGLILEFALITGMRPEEYLGLQWQDIDFAGGTAMVRRALVWPRGGGFELGATKTQGSRRSVPLPASLFAKLKSHRIGQLEQRLKLGASYCQNDLVFATDLGTPIHYRNLTTRHYNKVLKDAGLANQGFVLYSLRHSCATLLLSAGENPKVVAERLGHSSVKTTLDTYSHVLPDMQRSATEKLDAILYG